MKKDIKELIKWTLNRINMYSEDAASLIYRTGQAESGYRILRQYGQGPAIGFFQLEPATMNDIIDNYVDYRPQIKTDLYSLGYDDSDGAELRVMGNIHLQIAFCRLKYRRDKHPIPKTSDIIAQAEYWKRVYNSHLGKGTVEHFLKANGYEENNK